MAKSMLDIISSAVDMEKLGQNVDNSRYQLSTYNELSDKRIDHVLSMAVHNNVDGTAGADNNVYRQVNGRIVPYGQQLLSYASDFYATRSDIMMYYAERLKMFPEKDADGKEIPENKKIREDLKKDMAEQMDIVQNLENEQNFKGFHAMVHPYAIMHLPGAIEDGKQYAVDRANWRRWYETDGADSRTQTSSYNTRDDYRNSGQNDAHYAKNPTTTSIINWGRQDERGRFPYMYQDFVFSKYWNRIPNNRMITLRRYPAPATDNVEPADYVNEKDKSAQPFAPLATAITYFGEGTENKLSDILKFTVGYEWEEIKGDVWQFSTEQNDDGKIFGQAGNGSWLGSGAGFIAHAMGIMGSLTGNEQTEMKAEYAKGLPPDPYAQGNMYENRIMGPVNVINNVYKRKRGLKFTGDGLSIKFDYIARPISNVNTKAIMLDILANILIMTSATGTWFGGIQRYRTEKPAVFPMSKDIHNKLYSGNILGPNGVFTTMMQSLINPNGNFSWNAFMKDMWSSVTTAANDIVNAVKHLGNKEERKKDLHNAKSTITNSDSYNTVKDTAETAWNNKGKTLNDVLTAKLTQGANVPWVKGTHALLTGDPVGDWHLTIGNPLNPIAMIGNLIMDSCDIKFYDELGPDDFPIGFTATIKLKHGMGRDRDAVESMFNKGYGRIYTLPDTLKSSADFETTVDNYTGVHDEYKYMGGDEIKYNGMASDIVTSGADFIYGANIGSTLSNSGSDAAYRRNHYNMNLRTALFSDKQGLSSIATYKMQPWTARYTL